jgi:hypothetical protein
MARQQYDAGKIWFVSAANLIAGRNTTAILLSILWFIIVR